MTGEYTIEVISDFVRGNEDIIRYVKLFVNSDYNVENNFRIKIKDKYYKYGNKKDNTASTVVELKIIRNLGIMKKDRFSLFIYDNFTDKKTYLGLTYKEK